MSQTPSHTAFDLSPTLGAFEIGVMISIFLFGVVTVQTFTYYKKFPNDKWYLQTFVGVLWALELVHTITTAQSLYYISVTKYGQPQFIPQFPISLVLAITLSGIIGPAVQAFFANRIRFLSSSWIVPCIAWLLSLLRSISVIAVAGTARATNDVVRFKHKWLWLLVTSLSISTTTDILIAVSLCYYLWRQRDSSLKRTKRLVDKLIFWTIQTGLLTSLATTALLIVFVLRNDYTWVAIFFCVCRLFSNSLMASLNARSSLRALNKRLDFMNDSNFRLQPTRRSNINVAVKTVSEHDIEFQKSCGVDPGRTQVVSYWSAE